MSDMRAAQARELNQKATEHDRIAESFRAQRDRLVRLLRVDDPKRWTYAALARELRCSPELIAHIMRGKT